MMDEVYHFGVLFKQISLAFETAMQREAERYDLTPAQANILIYLSEVLFPVSSMESYPPLIISSRLLHILY